MFSFAANVSAVCPEGWCGLPRFGEVYVPHGHGHPPTRYAPRGGRRWRATRCLAAVQARLRRAAAGAVAMVPRVAVAQQGHDLAPPMSLAESTGPTRSRMRPRSAAERGLSLQARSVACV